MIDDRQRFDLEALRWYASLTVVAGVTPPTTKSSARAPERIVGGCASPSDAVSIDKHHAYVKQCSVVNTAPPVS